MRAKGSTVSADAASVHGVILAAGLSSRFGADKLLHDLGGRPIFSWILESALQSALVKTVLVCRNELLFHLPSHPGLEIVLNPEPEAGQSSSLRLGLSALPEGATHVLFMLADQPLVSASLIDTFIALARDGCTLACLANNDYLGPPALFGREWFERLQELDGDSGAKKVLLAGKKGLLKVPVQFNGQEQDIDCHADIATLKDLLEK